MRRSLGTAIFVLATTLHHAALADTIHVEIRGLMFSPTTIAAHVGDEIEWMNEDFVAHTATARHGEWDISLPPHATGHVELKKPGRIEYYCRFHPNMRGEITIAPQ
jgi:plastocyanin